jgi:hypothetical protein
MANKATADGVQRDMQPPNFRAAVQRIRTIPGEKKKIAERNEKIGETWAAVEGFKVDKRAGKAFATLDNLEPHERAAYMRSLNGLIDAAGWEESFQDLVDSAEGTAVSMRVGGGEGPDGAGGAGNGGGGGETGDGGAGGDGGRGEPEQQLSDAEIDDFEASEAEIAAQKGRQEEAEKREVLGARKPKKASVAAVGEPTKPRTRRASEQAPFTGDNSDLVSAEPAGRA